MDLKINDISNIFQNINHKPCTQIGYDFEFEITEKGKLIGELFYSKEFKEWFLIKDNFPMPRKGYRISFPVKTIEFFISVLDSAGIKLVKSTE